MALVPLLAREFIKPARACLLADAGLVAACTGGQVLPAARAGETRIYGESLPEPPIVDGQKPKVLPATVVVSSAGGQGLPGATTAAFGRVELRCYDTTRERCSALWYQAFAVLSLPYLDRAGGVWFEANAAAVPILDAELGSDFLVARAMVGLTLLYH